MKTFVRVAKVLGLLWIFSLSPSSAFAGPWSKAPGNFYVKVNQGFLFSSDGTDPANPGNPYFSSMTSFYAEVGIYYGLQIYTSLPYAIATLSREKTSEFYTLSSFGDANFGLQWTPPFLQKRFGFPMAIRLDTKVPLYNAKIAEKAGDPGIPKEIEPRFPFLGEGQIDVTLWLSIGGSIPNTPLYAFGEIGYRFRTERFLDQRLPASVLTFSDGLVAMGQLGYTFWPRMGWIAMFNVSAILPLLAKDDRLTRGNVQLGLALYLPLWKKLALEATFDVIVLTINTDRALNLSAGISYKF